jgi:SAM-dependent methyltransferase
MAGAKPEGAGKNFRFYDNRQKYLMFVNTCSEKRVIAERVLAMLAALSPRPPALRFFDAGVGDGSVLTRVLRGMHQRFPRFPLYIGAKEISLEDIRLTLEKMPDRFFEHPEMVLALTNLPYAQAPWLAPASAWHEVALEGTTSAEFERQIVGLQPFLDANWKTRPDPKTGRLLPETPAVLVLYRKDCRFLLDGVIPRQGQTRADFDLVLASQPYRLRADVRFKAEKVLAPMARALGPGGKVLAIHSAGDDPGIEIVRQVWPGEDPFVTTRQELLAEIGRALGPDAHEFTLDPLSDAQSLFRYDMHTLPDEIDSEAASIGTSTLLAAWNAATYVAQIDDARLSGAMTNSAYLDATRDVLKRHGALWFNDESFVISRR